MIISSEQWHQFRVLGNEEHARSFLEHVGLSDPQHVIFMPSGRHNTHTSIFVRNDNDAVAVRMAV